MARTPIFNDYDENGRRVSATGNRSTKIEDEAIVYNLRTRWRKELEDVTDSQLVNAYDHFALDESFGDNDEHFLEFLRDYLENS